MHNRSGDPLPDTGPMLDGCAEDPATERTSKVVTRSVTL